MDTLAPSHQKQVCGEKEEVFEQEQKEKVVNGKY